MSGEGDRRGMMGGRAMDQTFAYSHHRSKTTKDEKPDNWSMDALSEHLDAGHQNCYAFFANCHTEFEKLHIIDDTFRKLVATIEVPRLNISHLPVVPHLFLRAHASFVSASHW